MSKIKISDLNTKAPKTLEKDDIKKETSKLAKKIQEMTANLDWSTIDGMILMNHGVFTFHNEAKVSYKNMIDIVTKATVIRR